MVWDLSGYCQPFSGRARPDERPADLAGRGPAAGVVVFPGHGHSASTGQVGQLGARA